MPSGKTHNVINIVSLPVILLSLYLLSSRYHVLNQYMNLRIISVFTASYLFGTFFLSPDLDIESSSYERWGILRFLWWPYKVLFKHRGISHHPVFGPLTILANLALISIPLLWLAGISISSLPHDITAAVVLGIIISNEIHIVVDKIVSEL